MAVRAAILLVSTLTAAVFVSACRRESGGGGPADSFDRRAMLANLADAVILPAIRDFRDASIALEDATTAALAAVATADSAARLADARAAWVEAMDAWQVLEVMHVGPAGSATRYTGGQGLRDEIYSWPTVNTCRVDQEIVDAEYRNAGFFDAELVNVYGLDALEWLLFHQAPGNSCPSQVTINANGTWNAIGYAEIARRRADYADAVAERLEADAAALLQAWETGFRDALANAGLSGSPFSSAHAAVNEVFAAMFYVELVVKDEKLAVPAGLSVECPTATCPELAENRWSDRSAQNVATNLRAFRRLLLGGEPGSDGAGFDDFLVELGAPDLAARMESNLAIAIGSATAVTSMNAALTGDPTPVRQVHTDLKTVTDDLKSQFVTVLNLTVPDEGAGDND